MTKRIIALSFIFACTWAGWGALTLVIMSRTDQKSDTVSDAVASLWGSEHTQEAPMVTAKWHTTRKRQVRRTHR